MYITRWDLNKSGFENGVMNMVSNSMGEAALYSSRDEVLDLLGSDGEWLGRLETVWYIKYTYGDNKPTCLGDKILRELTNAAEDTYHEAERFANTLIEEQKRVIDDVTSALEVSYDALVNVAKAAENVVKKVFGGCFITTATLYSKGITDDNCKELVAIRKWRDEYILLSTDGHNIVRSYYEIAPKIVEKIGCNKAVYRVIWNNYLVKVLKCLETNQRFKAKIIYLEMVDKLRIRYGV